MPFVSSSSSLRRTQSLQTNYDGYELGAPLRGSASDRFGGVTLRLRRLRCALFPRQAYLGAQKPDEQREPCRTLVKEPRCSEGEKTRSKVGTSHSAWMQNNQTFWDTICIWGSDKIRQPHTVKSRLPSRVFTM